MKVNDNNDETIGPKVRVDSWAAQLTSDQQWKLYRRAQQSGDWMEAVAWAKSELHLGKLPGHSAFYSWMAAMRRAEGERRLEELAATIAEATALGNKMPKEDALVKTYNTLALEAAVSGNFKAADTCMKIAGTVQKLYFDRLAFEQKEAERKKQAAIGKFLMDDARRERLIFMADKSGKTLEETAEDYKHMRAYCKRITDDMFKLPS